MKTRLMAKINNRPSILVDISKTGFKLSAASIPESREVNITLQADNQTFSIKGNTRWINRKVAAPRMYDIGISLKEATPEYFQFIERLFPN